MTMVLLTEPKYLQLLAPFHSNCATRFGGKGLPFKVVKYWQVATMIWFAINEKIRKKSRFILDDICLK